MKMPAGFLFRGAARMEYQRAFIWRKTGQFQFLERGGRHGGDLRPMPDDLRVQLLGFADFAVGGIVLKLQGEQLQRERTEFFTVGADVRRLIICLVHRVGIETSHVVSYKEFAQARGEAGKWLVHAVFVCRLVFRDSRQAG